ncbi:MAG: carbohydrate porin [Xanthobacteraceae bacterium]
MTVVANYSQYNLLPSLLFKKNPAAVLKKICLGSLVAALGGGGELAAADLQRPMMTSAYSWTGLYIGGHFGYGTGSFGPGAHPLPLQAVALPSSATGFIGGFQAGYNLQTGSNLVLGVETDVTFVSPRTTPIPQQPPFDTTYDLFGTTRIRVGYAYGNWLPFVTGGFAWGKTRINQYDSEGEVLALKPANQWGWTTGLGIEYALTGRWTAKLEYDYIKLGATTYDLLPPAPAQLVVDPNIHVVKVGFNYRLLGDVPAASTGAAPWRAVASEDSGWSIHGQTTVIPQGYSRIRSPYQGPNSLPGAGQVRETWTTTAFIGRKLWEGGEVYFNPELAQGGGLAGTVGLGGFSNGEAQKAGAPYPRLRAQRYFLRQTFGFGGEQETVEDGPNQIAGKRDIDRLTVTVGRFATGDFFDVNSYAHDPRADFLNWAMWSSAAYDFPADLPGYTRGGVAEFNRKDWTLRAGVFEVPPAPNSDVLRFDSGGAVIEFEDRYTLFNQPGKFRIGAFANRGHMASYREAINAAAADPTIDINVIVPNLRRTNSKNGFYGNFEQAIDRDVGIFGRVSWNDGKNEILSFTDIDRSVTGGISVKGTSWGRAADTVGVGGAMNGLTQAHRDFLAVGGLGLLIGDGTINYRTERIFETYYSIGLRPGMTFSLDYQFVANLAYNADRGPVSIFAGRFHTEF